MWILGRYSPMRQHPKENDHIAIVVLVQWEREAGQKFKTNEKLKLTCQWTSKGAEAQD